MGTRIRDGLRRMNEVQLVCVTNSVAVPQGRREQELSFLILVDNIAFRKRVEVVWAGEDGLWRTLPAKYLGPSGEGKEYWRAAARFAAGPDGKLPGDIRFALRYEVAGAVFWDNRGGQDHRSRIDSGTRLAEDLLVHNVGFDGELDLAQRLVPVSIAVGGSAGVERVTVHWTTDGWRSANTTRCAPAPGCRGTPNRYGVAVWEGRLDVGTADSLQYCISREADGRVLWDNNRGRNYGARRRPLNLLILNLHCYQEENQDFKLGQVARAVEERRVDIVCLQEVAEPWNEGRGDWPSNSANLINRRLPAPYHIAADWSHLGFGCYREGVAILSRFPFAKKDARYVSRSHDPYDINARKVVMAQIAVPVFGTLNVFSCHLSWWDGGFGEQFRNLSAWAGSEHTAQVSGTLLCGDFNVEAGSQGYELVVEDGDFEDQYLAAASPRVFDRVFGQRQPKWQRALADDRRIDYVFLKRSSRLRVASGCELFTERDYGRVSDHTGYLLAFRPA